MQYVLNLRLCQAESEAWSDNFRNSSTPFFAERPSCGSNLRELQPCLNMLIMIRKLQQHLLQIILHLLTKTLMDWIVKYMISENVSLCSLLYKNSHLEWAESEHCDLHLLRPERIILYFVQHILLIQFALQISDDIITYTKALTLCH